MLHAHNQRVVRFYQGTTQAELKRAVSRNTVGFFCKLICRIDSKTSKHVYVNPIMLKVSS